MKGKNEVWRIRFETKVAKKLMGLIILLLIFLFQEIWFAIMASLVFIAWILVNIKITKTYE